MQVANVDTTITALTGAIGADIGTPFTFNAAFGRFASIKSLEVWAGGDRINGVRVETTDGDAALAGRMEGPSQRFDFHVGERITALSLWGNGAGAYLGAIKFTTSSNRHFDFGMTSWGRKTEYPMEVASGLFVWIYGNFESDGVRCMGFLFYQKVRASYLSEVEFPAQALAEIQITPRNIVEEVVRNGSDSSQTITLTGNYTVTERNDVSYSGNVTAEGTFSTEVTLAMKTVQPKFEPTETTKKSGSIRVSTTHGGTNSYGTTRTTSVQYTIPVAVAARGKTRVNAVVYDTKADNVEFSANVHLELETGARITIPIKGYYSGVSATSLDVEYIKLE